MSARGFACHHVQQRQLDFSSLFSPTAVTGRTLARPGIVCELHCMGAIPTLPYRYGELGALGRYHKMRTAPPRPEKPPRENFKKGDPPTSTSQVSVYVTDP
ncbi:hypothetical protein VTI74DRAFT_9783 [Chaetomium olivicolor]